jgi:thiamine-monophosphate kinase
VPSLPALPADATLADVGEFALIERVVAVLADVTGVPGQPGQEGDAQPAWPEHVLVGPGDDAALVRTRGHVVVSTDLLVEGRHFRRDWADAADVGARAAAQNISDVNAMGGRAHSLTLGIAAPPDLPAAWVLELVRGFAEEAHAVGAAVVGGDVTRASEVVLAVTVLGACTVQPVLRSGARPGDVLALAGRQGWAAAGLAVLGRGFRSPRSVVEAYRRPAPPYDAGPAAAQAGATSMVDVSDGLLAEAGHLAHDSRVAIDVETARLEVAEPLHAVAAATGADPVSFVLTGGDDHALLATFPSDAALPHGWLRIGSVAEGEGEGVTVDGQPHDGPAGWTHF